MIRIPTRQRLLAFRNYILEAIVEPTQFCCYFREFCHQHIDLKLGNFLCTCFFESFINAIELLSVSCLLWSCCFFQQPYEIPYVASSFRKIEMNLVLFTLDHPAHSRNGQFFQGCIPKPQQNSPRSKFHDKKTTEAEN